MSKQWTEEEISFLKDNYKSMTYKQLSEYLNRSKTAIDLKINRLGLKKEKYTYNHDYFACIDTADKAYWLGFIYADGGIFVNEKLNSCELSIKLQLCDINHLKKFNKSINGNNQISIFDRRCNLNDNYYQGCQIRLYSEKIVHDLEKQGVCQNKSLVIEMPNIPEYFISHFIRGVFDGDGCITKSNHVNGKSYIRCDFTSGSKKFLEQLRKKLYEHNISSYICNDHDNVLRLVIGGMKNCDTFLKFIYNDANIYLDRKYEKKNRLYDELRIEQRLLLQSERAGLLI